MPPSQTVEPAQPGGTLVPAATQRPTAIARRPVPSAPEAVVALAGTSAPVADRPAVHPQRIEPQSSNPPTPLPVLQPLEATTPAPGPEPGTPAAPSAETEVAALPRPDAAADRARDGAIFDVLRTTDVGPCRLLQPSDHRRPSNGLVALGTDLGGIGAASALAGLAAGRTDALPLDWVSIDPSGCDAIDFVRAHADVRADGLALSPNRRAIVSGDAVTGSVTGTGDRTLSLVIVDREGLVHDATKFLATVDDGGRYEIPVFLLDEPRPITVLLLAIATTGPVALPGFPAPASLWFADLAKRLTATRSTATAAVSPLTVRPKGT